MFKKSTCSYLWRFCLLLPGFVVAHTNNDVKLTVRNNCPFPVEFHARYDWVADASNGSCIHGPGLQSCKDYQVGALQEAVKIINYVISTRETPATVGRRFGNTVTDKLTKKLQPPLKKTEVAKYLLQESSNKWKSKLPYTLNHIYPSHLLSSADLPHKSWAEFAIFKVGDTTTGNEMRVTKYGELPNFTLTACPNVLDFSKELIMEGVKRILVFGDQF